MKKSEKTRIKPRKAPSQERAQQTVSAILTATAHILIRDGYDRMSTNLIAEVAGVSIGSLYQYFPSKDAIVAALVESHIQEELALVEKTVANVAEAPLERAVEELVRATFITYSVNPRLKRAMLEQIPRTGLFARLRETRVRLEKLIASDLVRHKAEIRELDCELAAFILVNAVDAIVQVTKSERTEYLADDRLTHEIREMILRYLGAAPEARKTT